jgi:outer membrane protein assembly factor BamD
MACRHTGARLSEGRLLVRGRMRGLRLAAVVVAVALTAACAGTSTRVPVGTPEPDKFLFERGTEALEKRRWFTAREYFRQLMDTYPQSPYRADAKLGIGDTYLGEGTAEAYVLAQNEFREFLAFYPTHRRADYAQFKLGMTHFYQMHGPERDQTETKEAIRELAAFVERYANSALAPEGKKYLREARDRLSEHTYRVGLFYYRTLKYYPAAIDRFREVLQTDPQYTGRDAVYFHMAESLVKVERPAEALPFYERLVQEFEKSEYLEQAQKRVEQIKAEIASRIKPG